MLTQRAQHLVDAAKRHAHSTGSVTLTLDALLAAVGEHSEATQLLADCMNVEPADLRGRCPEFAATEGCLDKLPLDEATRSMLSSARELARQVADRSRPGWIDLRHLVCALSISRDATKVLQLKPITRKDAVLHLSSWYSQEDAAPSLPDLADRVRRMRTMLLSRVFGQDHAVQAFVEGIFNSEITAAADRDRRAPRAVFTFAGPPGVGKTYLAELGADHLGLPFKRFDMSAYSDHQAATGLIGMAPSYRSAAPGGLTGFVEQNPSAVLLLDEIEKAHLNTIQLFLQVLDSGTLEDKYHERAVSFRDTTLVFTTNAGRKLYDSPNETGVQVANASFHRQTILDALKSETDPRTREPVFPAPICSRMATGYPVMFNRLGANELERVVRFQLDRTGRLLQQQYHMEIQYGDLLSTCLVLREGAGADARALCAQAESFVKSELFKFCQLYKTERLDEVLETVERVGFTLEDAPGQMDAEVRRLFEGEDPPSVLLVSDQDLVDLYSEFVDEVSWKAADSADHALQILADEEVDMVLLDLWLGQEGSNPSMTVQHFDHPPAAARSLEQGQELLRKIRTRLPNMPVYLLSLCHSEGDASSDGSIDEELFLACVRGGGARGLITSRFIDGMVKGWKQHRDELIQQVLQTCQQLHREKAGQRLGQARKVLTFDTAPRVDEDRRKIHVRLRNLRLSRAVAAGDAHELLDDVQRPSTRFEDVIGADAAKDELRFFLDHLKNPRRFAALGLKAPKGVLLHGPPGTGKTMLARAMAGESNVAFLPVAATNFVTKWQGSGPENIREIFRKARRYAPSIVFIDEIDAIGKPRSGSSGGRAEESTLNTLLTEMDGFASEPPERSVFVLAATNFSLESDESSSVGAGRGLDAALVRRFSRTILVDLPERQARAQFLSLRLKAARASTVTDETIKLIAERSPGMSIASLEWVVETAVRNAVKAGTALTGELLEDALESARFGEQRPRAAEVVLRTARHEAGHTILYWLSGWWPSYVTVVSRGNHGGYMAPSAEDVEDTRSRTREELLAMVRTSLGGRAAELLYYGPEDGLSTGASQDLVMATRTARAVVCDYGMDEGFGLAVAPESSRGGGAALSGPVHKATNRILLTEMKNSVEFLESNRRYLDAVAEALLDKERLTRDELQGILPEQGGNLSISVQA